MSPLADQIATSQSWKTIPLGPMAAIPYDATFSAEEYGRLHRGLIAVGMEDKWFIFWDADSLFLHRSWTGYCVYRVHFRPASEWIAVAEAEVASDCEHYRRGSDDHEVALLDFLIRGRLLQQAVQFPVPQQLAGSESSRIYQHHSACV